MVVGNGYVLGEKGFRLIKNQLSYIHKHSTKTYQKSFKFVQISTHLKYNVKTYEVSKRVYNETHQILPKFYYCICAFIHFADIDVAENL